MTLADIPNRGTGSLPKSHGKMARGFDAYFTPPAATRALMKAEPLPRNIWEPAAGDGAIVDVLRAQGHTVVAHDLVSYGRPDIPSGIDFLMEHHAPATCATIVTNPPYRLAADFIRHGLDLVPNVIVLLRLAFLEGTGRSDLIDGGKLARVHVFRNRLEMMHRHGWTGPKSTSATAFAWFSFNRNHTGPTVLKRISWEKT